MISITKKKKKLGQLDRDRDRQAEQGYFQTFMSEKDPSEEITLVLTSF